mgnify:FL=1
MSKLLNSLPIYIMSQESDNSTNNQRKDALNNMNNEFVETLNDLMSKKKKFQKKINKEKTKLAELLQNLNTLTAEKNTLENSIKKKQKSLDTINKTINSTQAAHQKIIEASHVLLTIIKKDQRNIKEN